MNAAGWTVSIIGIAIALAIVIAWEHSSRRGADALPGNGPERSPTRYEFLSPSWITMATGIEGDPSQATPVLMQLDIHRLLAGHTA